jgi:glycolate oxidase FAD binding subunit
MALHEPDSEQGVADCVRAARAAGETLELQGGGTRLALGRPVQAAATLSLARHSGIVAYDPGALTLVAKAGTPMAEIEAALSAERQQLAFEPIDHRGLLGSEGAPTIGGVVATGASGPRRVQAGACRDFLLGIRYVTGEGAIARSGGRVMKNVTGYDLAKLQCGAFGTLGVVTEVAFKTLPAPERAATLALRGLTDAEAVAAMAAALGSPFEVSGAAHLPDHPVAALTALRVEGLESQVSRRLEGLKDLAPAGAPVEILEGEAHAALWTGVRDAAPFHDRAGAVWRIALRPSAAPGVAAALREALMQTAFTPDQLADPQTARSNEVLRSCVHCGFCTATCPTYGARRRARQPARADLPDQGHAGERAQARRRRRSPISTAASPASPA